MVVVGDMLKGRLRISPLQITAVRGKGGGGGGGQYPKPPHNID